MDKKYSLQPNSDVTITFNHTNYMLATNGIENKLIWLTSDVDITVLAQSYYYNNACMYYNQAFQSIIQLSLSFYLY